MKVLEEHKRIKYVEGKHSDKILEIIVYQRNKEIAQIHGIYHTLGNGVKVFNFDTAMVYKEEDRRKGVGTHLMRIAEQEAKKRGVDAILLIDVSSKEGRELSKKCGYKMLEKKVSLKGISIDGYKIFTEHHVKLDFIKRMLKIKK